LKSQNQHFFEKSTDLAPLDLGLGLSLGLDLSLGLGLGLGLSMGLGRYAKNIFSRSANLTSKIRFDTEKSDSTSQNQHFSEKSSDLASLYICNIYNI
jgi:hypothetical protein